MTQTIIQPDVRPADLILLGPTPAATLRSANETLRYKAQQIIGCRQILRATGYADRLIWQPLAAHNLAEFRVQYRALLRARRAIRQLVERAEDRTMAQVNGNG